MGFFSKIKQNINHGGVSVSLQAPASVSTQDPVLPVVVNITNGPEQRTVNSVGAEIIASSRNQSFQSGTASATSTESMGHTVARAENVQPFQIAPGETKAVQLDITMNAGAAAAEQLPEGSAMAQVAGAFQKLQSINDTLNAGNYVYSLRVSADVEGISLDPAKEEPLQILGPGQIGGGFNATL